MTDVLQAILDAAVAATSAELGWIVALRETGLSVVAAAGPGAGQVVGTDVPSERGTVGYVLGSGQPLAVVPHASQPNSLSEIAAMLGRTPGSVMCVPCDGGTSISGALELVDKAAGARFSFDDLELVTLLAGIAGVALDQASDVTPSVPTTAELGAQLASLADADPGRYASLAPAISAMLRGA